ncbi:hypothetical protein [Corallococcus sicarius]|uniref:Flagellar assembly protein T N-terminal domain-containing protein n=1 Tax=Corallococcus sicarius TaxID=2316726 RepID=A0A3A8NX10_9BACT|nr:hypothetical protein [Corallococcus sicarius]RKH47680.1 hypothetical protein D7X12_02125 [Corallococcus sicarius]
MPLKLSALCVFLATTALAAAPKPALPPGVVVKEASGEAAIVGGNVDKAFNEAKAAALREAVEQVAGVMVSADTLTANSQLISDRVFTNSAGYVRRYDVLGREVLADVAKVTVRAEVGTEQLDKDLQAVQALIRRLGSPKLVILTQEQTVDPKGVVTNGGLFATVLTEAFKQDQWTIIDPHFAAGKVRLLPGVALSATEAKEIGDLSRADYILYGTVVFRQQPPTVNGIIPEVDAQGRQLVFSVSGEYDLAVFATDNGSQLAKVAGKFASGPDDLGGPSKAVISYDRTAYEIARRRGQRIVTEVRAPVIEYVRASQQDGNRVSMTVLGLKDYAAVQAFRKVLAESLTGLKGEPGKATFGKEATRFDLTFLGGTDELAGQLGGKTFQKRKVLVTGVTANTVELTVAP